MVVWKEILTVNEYGNRCLGCGFCVHADKEKMKCFPESEDCKKEYDLEEEDFNKECNCDFFKLRRN